MCHFVFVIHCVLIYKLLMSEATEIAKESSVSWHTVNRQLFHIILFHVTSVFLISDVFVALLM